MSSEPKPNQLTAIQIGEKEYQISDLPGEASSLIQSIQFTNSELLRAQALVAVLMTAKARYEDDLKKLAEKSD